ISAKIFHLQRAEIELLLTDPINLQKFFVALGGLLSDLKLNFELTQLRLEILIKEFHQQRALLNSSSLVDIHLHDATTYLRAYVSLLERLECTGSLYVFTN